MRYFSLTKKKYQIIVQAAKRLEFSFVNTFSSEVGIVLITDIGILFRLCSESKKKVGPETNSRNKLLGFLHHHDATFFPVW